MLSGNVNLRVLNSVGECNYGMYMLLTKGQEIDLILDSNSPIYQMYKYREDLINKNIGQSIIVTIDNNDNLKESLESIFQEYLSDEKFEVIKEVLLNHKNGWSLSKLIEIHREHKYYKICRILNTNYENWLN